MGARTFVDCLKIVHAESNIEVGVLFVRTWSVIGQDAELFGNKPTLEALPCRALIIRHVDCERAESGTNWGPRHLGGELYPGRFFARFEHLFREVS